MSLDGRSRQALSVVLHHDRDALVSRQREEIERLKTMMKNRYLRAALNLIDAKKEHDANAGHPEKEHLVTLSINEETLGPSYSVDGDEPDEFQVSVSEKRAMITGLCALGYHVVDASQTHGLDVYLVVCWGAISGSWGAISGTPYKPARMQRYFEGYCTGPREQGEPLPVLHLASPNPL